MFSAADGDGVARGDPARDPGGRSAFQAGAGSGWNRNLGVAPRDRPHAVLGADVPQSRLVPRFDRCADRSPRPRLRVRRASARGGASRGPRARRLPARRIFRPGRADADRIPDRAAGRRHPLDRPARRGDGRRAWKSGDDARDFDRQHTAPRGCRGGRGGAVRPGAPAARAERRTRATRRPAHPPARCQPCPDPGDLRQFSRLAEPVSRHRRRALHLRGPQQGDRAGLWPVARPGDRPPGRGNSRRRAGAASDQPVPGLRRAPARTSATRRAARWPA